MAHQSANASSSADGAGASHEPVQTAPREAFVTMETPLTAKFALAVSWNDIQYSVKEGKQNIDILKGLTGTALPGRTLAVMGSSGAGKTTFLNALADRLRRDGTHHLSGTMRLNDLPFDRKYRKLLGFVTQEDIVSPQATPEDALRFSLRIRRGVSASEADRKTAEMLEELKLTAVKDTMVGIPGIISGLSGGEKKRTNIGVELIADPKVMLLDEPTSGLDSVTSSRIVSLCRELSRKGRTVIFTIHQPTAECLQNFDDLMLMCAGGVAYHGTMEAAVPYFSSIGYACPDTYTPTDYFMILLQDKETGPKLVALWTEHLEGGHASAHTMSPTANDGEPVGPAPLSPSDKTVFLMPTGAETKVFLDDYVSKTGSSIGIQFVELMKRSFKGVSRNTLFIGMSIVQGLFFALVAGIMFVNIKDDVPGIQDRFGLLFMVCANRCFGGAMMMINTFPKEKAVFIREQQSGAYSPGIYFLAKSLSELPVQLASQILEALIIYFVAGLHIAPGSFFLYLATCFAAFQAATGLGMAISCAVPSFQLASGLAPLLIVPMMLAGGLLGSVSRLRPYWVWLEKISVIRYAFIILIRNELEPLDHIYCYPNDYTAVNGTAFCANQPKTGKAVLQQFEFTGTSHSYWLMWTCLACWIVAMRLVAVLALNRVAKSKE